MRALRDARSGLSETVLRRGKLDESEGNLVSILLTNAFHCPFKASAKWTFEVRKLDYLHWRIRGTQLYTNY
jgi:hypothetical protein